MISDFPDFGATPWVKGIAGGMANIRHSLSWGARMRAPFAVRDPCLANEDSTPQPLGRMSCIPRAVGEVPPP
jgi:hypothetical protein